MSQTQEQTRAKAERITNALKAEWEEFASLCETLSDEEWRLPTACPGWDVKDNLAHIIGTEHFLMGEKPPEVELGDTAHVKNDIGQMNESWIQSMRGDDPADVLERFKKVTASRIETLSNLSDEEWEKAGMTPVGEAPYLRFMQIRIMDSWMHEQDIREAAKKPGNTTGTHVEICLEEMEMAMGFVVGKLGGAPDGCKVVFNLTGDQQTQIKVEVKGKRAEVVDELSDVDIKIQLDFLLFTRLIGGRTTAKEVFEADKDAIEVEVSPEHGETAKSILQNMGYMF